jgi:hypothetical protein
MQRIVAGSVAFCFSRVEAGPLACLRRGARGQRREFCREKAQKTQKILTLKAMRIGGRRSSISVLFLRLLCLLAARKSFDVPPEIFDRDKMGHSPRLGHSASEALGNFPSNYLSVWGVLGNYSGDGTWTAGEII